MNKSNKWKKIDLSKIEKSKDINDSYYFIQDDDLMDVDYFIKGFTDSNKKLNENKIKKIKKIPPIKPKSFQSINNSPKQYYNKNTTAQHKTSYFELNKIPKKKNSNLKIPKKMNTDIGKFVKNTNVITKNSKKIDKKNLYQKFCSISGRKSNCQISKNQINKNTYSETEPNINKNNILYKTNNINSNAIKRKYNTIQQTTHQCKPSKLGINNNKKKLNLNDLIITDKNQKEFMNEIDIIFKKKINCINEINKKFDNELSILKEYIDNSNKNNVNNIIYDSVFNDKITEMNDNEKKYINEKQNIINKYKDNAKNVQKYFLEEIKNAVNNIKDNLPEK